MNDLTSTISISAQEAARTAALLAALEQVQAVIEFDTEGRVQRANHLFLNLMGYTAEEVEGQHHRMFCPPEVVASDAYRAMWDGLRAGEVREDVFLRVTKSGQPVWLQASYNPVRDLSGRTVGVVKLATDVTARRMQQADFERLTGDRRVNDLAIWLQPGASAATVEQAIRALVEPGGTPAAGAPQLLEFASAAEIRATSLRIFDRSFAVTYWLQAVAIGIGLFGVAASFSAQVLARRKEFGLLGFFSSKRIALILLTAMGLAVQATPASAQIVVQIGPTVRPAPPPPPPRAPGRPAGRRL